MEELVDLVEEVTGAIRRRDDFDGEIRSDSAKLPHRVAAPGAGVRQKGEVRAAHRRRIVLEPVACRAEHDAELLRLDELIQQMAELYLQPAVLLRRLWLAHEPAPYQPPAGPIIFGEPLVLLDGEQTVLRIDGTRHANAPGGCPVRGVKL